MCSGFFQDVLLEYSLDLLRMGLEPGGPRLVWWICGSDGSCGLISLVGLLGLMGLMSLIGWLGQDGPSGTCEFFGSG